jgi:16S rRNA (cytidine1402-2'-O)-methyltransferase
MSGTLYVIGTPIGNLEDMTLRQLRMLQEVDFIAAEDTRVTRKLLSHYDIHTPMVSYHDHSGQLVTQQLLQRIAAGETCGIVTDAGMPCISDPGEILVRCCKEQGIPSLLFRDPVQQLQLWQFPDRKPDGLPSRGSCPSPKNSEWNTCIPCKPNTAP